jgi:hypothetical protein
MDEIMAKAAYSSHVLLHTPIMYNMQFFGQIYQWKLSIVITKLKYIVCVQHAMYCQDLKRELGEIFCQDILCIHRQTCAAWRLAVYQNAQAQAVPVQ